MYCNICTDYSSGRPSIETSAFVTGCDSFRIEIVRAHDGSDAHKRSVELKLASEADKSQASTILVSLNKNISERLNILFRNAHFIAKEARPYRDYVVISQLDKAKGLDVGETYLNDESASNFVQAIAETVRLDQNKIVEMAKFISIISDGATDSACKEAEIVYLKTAADAQASQKCFKVAMVLL